MKELAGWASIIAFITAGCLVFFAMTLADPNEVIPSAFGGVVTLAIAIALSAVSESHAKSQSI